MENTLSTRLKSLRTSKGKTMLQVAESIGVSFGAYQKYENGTRDVSTDTLCKLADFFGVSADYLLGRESAPDPFELLNLQTEINEDKVFEEYMMLPKDVRKIILDVIKQLASAAESKCSTIKIRLHQNKAAAGYGYDLLDRDAWREIEVTDTPQARQADFAVEVSGDSMAPSYHNGDIVLVKATPSISIGDVGLFVHDGKGYIKECGEDRLMSRNQEYPDIYGESRCVGVVIGIADVI